VFHSTAEFLAMGHQNGLPAFVHAIVPDRCFAERFPETSSFGCGHQNGLPALTFHNSRFGHGSMRVDQNLP
jgi:hypothetical protein